jgi:hypothetical protein
MTDFSKVVSEEDSLVEGSTGGGFTLIPAVAGVALLRLRDVLELGTVMGEYAGKPKEKRPVIINFELVHPRHAINKKADNDPDDGPFTGDFIRYHEISVRLNKSNSDKSMYMKLFNKLNFDGAVATPKGKIPSFVGFAGKAYLGEVHHNTSDDGKTTYVNLDKGGEYTIGAPRVAAIDATLGTPTGEYNEIPVPEMNGDQRVFLWETGVSDEVYQQMWDSISIVGEKNDGTQFSNWIQESILRTEDDGKKKANIALEGSRAQRLFGTSAAVAELDDLISAGDNVTVVDPTLAATVAEEASSTAPAQPSETVAETPAPVADPLAALGL